MLYAVTLRRMRGRRWRICASCGRRSCSYEAASALEHGAECVTQVTHGGVALGSDVGVLDAQKRFGGPQVLRQVILEDVGLVGA